MTFIAESKLLKIASSLRDGSLSLTDYIHSTCNRLEKVNTTIHAFLPEEHRRERLLCDANHLIEKYKNTEKPVLYGVLIGVKDIFRVDGFPTQCGSALPTGLFEGEESVSVKKLKEAGALILGKTVTTEFAYFEPGETKNPHNTNHTPGGSSSGSAAAVAAGIVPLALGTQTIGSIIRPAAYCGTVGFKPTSGRISTAGVIPFSPTADHIGFFVQDLESVKLISSVLFNVSHEFKSYEKPLKIGIPEGKYIQQAHEEVQKHVELIVKNLEESGVLFLRKNIFEDIEQINYLHKQLVSAEIADVHKVWYKKYKVLYRHHTKLIIEDGFAVQPTTIDAALSLQKIKREEIDSFMQKENIDIWICPSTLDDAPEGIASTGSPIMNFPWTFVGMPVITIPAGLSKKGLPLGLQIIGRYGRDEELFHFTKIVSKKLSYNPLL